MNEKFKIGDLVKCVVDVEDFNFEHGPIAIVTNTHVNLWGEEVIPSGVEILLPDGEVEVWPEDELELVKEKGDVNE